MNSSETMRGSENEVLIESSFRRLLASIEAEREGIRTTWQQIYDQKASTAAHLEQLRQETEEWCYAERQKVDTEWKRLDKLRERMSILWPDDREQFHINCSGRLCVLEKTDLCTIEGSFLNHMFSDAFINNIPRDGEGRFFLDFNAECFELILQYLRHRRVKPDAPPPVVPPHQQQNMDMLAEALKLKLFLPVNRINPMHGTSLKVNATAKNSWEVHASTEGWQVISAAYPIPMASTAFFEIRVLANQEKRGGLAVGLCGHVPRGTEIHSIRLTDCVLYNSNIGIIGDAFSVDNVTKGIRFEEGDLFGVKHDALLHRLEWFHNRHNIGSASLKPEHLERMLQIYPVVALMSKGQRIEAIFGQEAPSSKGDKDDD